MKRSELESMGLTAEQIDKIMAENGKDIQAEKSKAETFRANSEKAEELQKQLDAINEKNMTEIEKANKLLEKANARIEELENANRISNLKSTVAEKFKVTTEQASQIIKEDGSMDYDILASIIAEKESAAANKKELEIAKGSTAPGSSTDTKTLTEAEQLAKNYGTYASNDKTAQSVVDSYL